VEIHDFSMSLPLEVQRHEAQSLPEGIKRNESDERVRYIIFEISEISRYLVYSEMLSFCGSTWRSKSTTMRGRRTKTSKSWPDISVKYYFVTLIKAVSTIAAVSQRAWLWFVKNFHVYVQITNRIAISIANDIIFLKNPTLSRKIECLVTSIW